ncbi:MAG: hypothetical protein NTX14_04240, partial [Candidatus Nealsonbacteria bacterium]|nr:hypothetical protein [Candidatus Nealsonbacteria bacterium]
WIAEGKPLLLNLLHISYYTLSGGLSPKPTLKFFEELFTYRLTCSLTPNSLTISHLGRMMAMSASRVLDNYG